MLNHDDSIDTLSDHDLVDRTARAVSQPREREADSFVLHAPLELLARRALLPFVAPSARVAARNQIAEIGTRFEAFGEGAIPGPAVDFGDDVSAAEFLTAAIGAGELDDVDSAAAWLGDRVHGERLRELLATPLVPMLSAAAHAPIFLYLLPRVAPRREVGASLLRPLAREVARHPEWRMRWVDDRPVVGDATSDELGAAIAAAPTLGSPGAFGIQPMMAQVDGDVAASVLGPVTGGSDIASRSRALLRLAASSMLTEPLDHAPYGWSHCLTMPQAVLGIAESCGDPSAALAVAATHVLGFRSALAVNDLVVDFRPGPTGVDLGTALTREPSVAAAGAFNARDDELSGLVTHLATRAATHTDAHLAKYTLACFDAAAADPDHCRLFLAAAASLSAWWGLLEE